MYRLFCSWHEVLGCNDGKMPNTVKQILLLIKINNASWPIGFNTVAKISLLYSLHHQVNGMSSKQVGNNTCQDDLLTATNSKISLKFWPLH